MPTVVWVHLRQLATQKLPHRHNAQANMMQAISRVRFLTQLILVCDKLT